MSFLLINSWCFSSRAAFRWPNWEEYLLELIVWSSRRSSQQRTPFHSLHIHNTTFFGVVGGSSFHLSQNLFCSLVYSIFSSLVTICLKNKMFSCYVSVENCVWNKGEEGIFRFTCVAPKHQSNEHS